MITSLPVSPCSSPLRQYGPAHKSCFLSPPHPSYPIVAQSSYNLNDYGVFPTRPTTNYTHDPWSDIPSFKSQTPGGSPRTRPIWVSKVTRRGKIIPDGQKNAWCKLLESGTFWLAENGNGLLLHCWFRSLQQGPGMGEIVILKS